MKSTVLIFILLCGMFLYAKNVVVIPEKSVILVPPGASNIVRSGANELQKHLALVTGVKVPIAEGAEVKDGVFTFLVGVKAPGANAEFAIEESRWVVDDNAVYLFGDDRFARRGSEYAVFNFLDKQLGIRWIEPGDDGIVFQPAKTLKLESGSFSWKPQLLVRCIRCVEFKDSKVDGLTAFDIPQKEYEQKTRETRRWQNRMLMCHRTNMFVFGHAFTKWWGKYGKEHPEYFAVNRSGKRAPETGAKDIYDPIAVGASAKTIKMCVSSPALVRQIVANFLAENPRPEYINLCENDDVGGYCRCEACLALDTIKNQNMDSNKADLTDRYLHFVNAVAKETALYNINISWYAYNQTKNPPRREKVASNVVIGTVPYTLNLAELEKFYAEWKKCGATRFTLRPNYHWITMQTGIPMGMEKHFYDMLNVAIRNGAIGADFDASQCHWSLNGIVDYILFRKMSHPEKSFEELEKEYYSAFGEAAGDVEEYFKYYRNEIFYKRLFPNMKSICDRGRFNNFARGVLWDLDKYYAIADFDRTDAVLQRAASRKLSPVERRRVGRLMLANKHSRLLFIAVTSTGSAKIKASVDLLNFRLEHRKDLLLDYNNLFRSERSSGGVETSAAITLKSFAEYKVTPLFWYALTDEKNAGTPEKWQTLEISDVRKKGFLLPTDSAWESISVKHAAISPETREKMKKYDGVVWYFQQITIPPQWRGKEIFLCFGAVDESCELFVNGKESGAHPFVKPTDWNTPFALRIDQNIDWELSRQTIAVRVTDTSGNGGIWKRVWLVRK